MVDAFSTYGRSWREITLPPIGAGSFGVALDALPDGRLIAVTGLVVRVETSPGSGVFTLAATIDPAIVGGSTDPSFVRISPGGARVALGAGFGKPVVVFDTSVLSSAAPVTISTTTSKAFEVPYDSAVWADDRNLALTAGAFGSPSTVTLLDTTSATGAPINPIIIDNIAGATGGIAFDAAGRLYTANGFDNGPGGTGTGSVRAFGPAAWSVATAAPDFESQGDAIIDILSGAGLAFDDAGNFFVGGGDFFGGGETGFLAVVRAGAVSSALAGLGPVDPLAMSDVRRLDPLGDGSGFYAALFNPVTRELLVQSGGRVFATVPEPGAVMLIIISAVGSAGTRRRDRHASA